MIKYIVSSIIILNCTFGFSQTSGINKAIGDRNFNDISNKYYYSSNQKIEIEDIDGQPFLNKNFNSGYIVNTDSGKKAKTYLRYNVFKDIFEIKFDLSSKDIKALEKSFNFQYQLNNEKFILIESQKVINELHYQSGNGFVSELTNPNQKAILYKRYVVELKPRQKARTTFEQDKPAEFELDKRYIIKFGNTFVRAEDHRKKILDAFPDHQKDMKKYIKDKEFKFRGDDKEVQNQMIQVVRYYNSLVN